MVAHRCSPGVNRAPLLLLHLYFNRKQLPCFKRLERYAKQRRRIRHDGISTGREIFRRRQANFVRHDADFFQTLSIRHDQV